MGREGRPLWHALREHAVHWVVGGVLLSLTGFVPEDWVAHTVHGLHLWRHADPWFVLEMGVDDGIKRGLCLES
jgi:hypothetical protein